MIAAAGSTQGSAIHDAISVLTALLAMSEAVRARIRIGIDAGVAGAAEIATRTVIPIAVAAGVASRHAAIATSHFTRGAKGIGTASQVC